MHENCTTLFPSPTSQFQVMSEPSSLQVATVQDAAIRGYESFVPWMDIRCVFLIGLTQREDMSDIVLVPSGLAIDR